MSYSQAILALMALASLWALGPQQHELGQVTEKLAQCRTGQQLRP